MPGPIPNPEGDAKRIADASRRLFKQIEEQAAAARKKFIGAIPVVELHRHVEQLIGDFRRLGSESIGGNAKKSLHDLKQEIRGLATAYPHLFSGMGTQIDSVFSETLDNAAKKDHKFFSKHVGRLHAVKDSMRVFGLSEEEINQKSLDVMMKGQADYVIERRHTLEQNLAAFTGNQDAQRKIFDKSQQDFRQKIFERTGVEKWANDLSITGAQRASKTTVLQASAQKGLAGYMARNVAMVKEVANIEKDRQKAIAGGRSPSEVKMSWGQRGIQAMIGSISKLDTVMDTLVDGFDPIMLALRELMDAVNNTTIEGGMAMQAFATQGPRGAQGLFAVAHAGFDARLATDDLRRTALWLGNAFDDLLKHSLALAASIGGLGQRGVISFTSALMGVALAAPAFGMASDAAMKLAVDVQGAFGIKTRHPMVEFLKTVSAQARLSGLSVEAFIGSMGGIQDLGVMWGSAAKQILRSASVMDMALKSVGIHRFTRMAMTSMLGQVARAPVSQEMAIAMFGGAHSATQAFQMARSPLQLMKGLVEGLVSHGLATKNAAGKIGLANADQRMRAALGVERLFPEFAPLSKIILSGHGRAEKMLNEVVHSASLSSKKIRALEHKMMTQDPEKEGVKIAKDQQAILSQILAAVDGISQNLAEVLIHPFSIFEHNKFMPGAITASGNKALSKTLRASSLRGI